MGEFVSREEREGNKAAKAIGPELEELASIAIDCGLKLHRDIGPGLLESAYEIMLAHLLEQRGLIVERQVAVPVEYDGLRIEQGFRIDILVNQKLILEIKSVERLMPVHGKQLLTYLKLMNLPLGLLMNFSNEKFVHGLKRIVNNHQATQGSKLNIHK